MAKEKLTPQELYPIEDWKYDVDNGDTKLGYEEWVEHNVMSHKPETDMRDAIDGLEEFPLTENQQRLVNYLRANIDDLSETLFPTE